MKALFILSLCIFSMTGFSQDEEDFERFDARPEASEELPEIDLTPPEGSEPPPSRRSRRANVNGVNIEVPGAESGSGDFRAKESNSYATNEEKVFGRQSEGVEDPSKKEKKYVSLNPETAFGPEIIANFDYPNADIVEVTKKMQALTGINLILDKDIKGKVSISAPSPITVGDAWKAYLVSLNMAGLALVKTGEFYRIINARDIRYTPTKIYTGEYVPDVENYMMKIIALKHVDANEIVRNFRPFMTRYGRILDIKQTNTIIVTDTGTNINRLMKLVKFLDVAGFEETMHILKVKNTSAQELAKLIDSIIKKDTGGSSRRSRAAASKASKTGPQISKIIAEPRTNSIIAMANAAGAEHLKKLLLKLDIDTPRTGSGKVKVYYVQHGTAKDLATTLTSLVSNAASQASSSSRAGTGSSSRRGSRFRAPEKQVEAIFSEEVKITSDEATNSLVVTASEIDWLTLQGVLAKLDIPRMQVYVEGLVVETEVKKNNAFGMGYVGAYGEAASQRAGFNAGGILNLGAAAAGDITKLGGVFTNFGVGFGLGKEVNIGTAAAPVNVNAINGFLKAVASDSQSNVLSTPQLLVLDNAEGQFEVTSKVPIITVNTAQGGTQTQGTDFQDVKTIIKIKPQINKATRMIKMKITQQFEDFSGTTSSSLGGRATTQRVADSEVIVRDRDTIAMGGLLRDSVSETYDKIPVLGDLPVLGWLFKEKKKDVRKLNTIFFLTPKIISPYDSLAADNTQDVIKRRNMNVNKNKILEDVHRPELNEIARKVEAQKAGPLYPKSLLERYNKGDGVGKGGSITFDDIPGTIEDDYTQFVEEDY